MVFLSIFCTPCDLSFVILKLYFDTGKCNSQIAFIIIIIIIIISFSLITSLFSPGTYIEPAVIPNAVASTFALLK
jgi:hypothetical protein